MGALWSNTISTMEVKLMIKYCYKCEVSSINTIIISKTNQSMILSHKQRRANKYLQDVNPTNVLFSQIYK